MDRNEVKRILAEQGLTPNRALGQNFLVDEAVIRQILDAAQIDGLPVVEVGPGLGALTEGLLARAAHVVAVEKDAALSALLSQRLSQERLTVITGDFLQIDPARLPADGTFVAVGNLPYYITTPLVERLTCLRPLSMTLMVQAEAAPRFFASPGERVYGPVAVLSQVLYTPMPVLEVSPASFYPPPEVDSRVVRLVRRDRRDVPDPQELLRFLKRLFATRRKTLRNVLARPAGLDRALAELCLPADVRAEAIGPETLLALYLCKERMESI